MRLLLSSVLVVVLFSFVVVSGAPGGSFVDDCYSATWTDAGSLTKDLKIVNSCEGGSYMSFPGSIDLTLLGNVVDGDVVVSSSQMAVDTGLRPDLDVQAILGFKAHRFAVEPKVLKDGVLCSSPNCNVTYSPSLILVAVDGFSTYSLQARQDFTVYSDYEPELKGGFGSKKVYQTIDLGDSYRSTAFACVVQLFGVNELDELVLVTTGPAREVPARLLGNPDTNQPESLGYFPTVNGMANTYFDGSQVYGYMDFELVIQCSSNSTKLIYEESISTRDRSAGRLMTSRGVWLTDGNNAFYVAFVVFLSLGLLFLGGLVWRRVVRR